MPPPEGKFVLRKAMHTWARLAVAAVNGHHAAADRKLGVPSRKM